MLKKLFILSTLVLALSNPLVSFANHDGHGHGKKSCDRQSENKCNSEMKLPCPIMALEKSKELGLDSKQTKALSKIKKSILKDSKALKEKIKTKNESLVNEVVAGTLEGDKLAKRVQEIANLQGKLRLIKMEAHIKTMKTLTPEQLKQLSSPGCDRKSGKKAAKKECCKKK